MTTSLVHGSRGIHVRALNFTMMCGNGGGSTQEGTYRCPNLMLNWGPSVETTNPDMIGRLHDVVRMLTGKNTSNPDFVSALIDENYVVLDTNEVQNAILSGWQHATWNVDHNFIALEETESEDVLLLVVNDSSSPFEEELENYIYFPDRYMIDYSIEHIAGFECDTSSRSKPELNLYYLGMPAYAASLYLLEYTGGF